MSKSKSLVRIDPAARGEIVPMVLESSVFRAIRHVCRESILASGNQPAMRQSIAALIVDMRQIALVRFGHDTPDINELVDLLRRTDPALALAIRQERPAEKDPIAELRRQHHLSLAEASAAEFIRRIWNGWSRFLMVSAKTTDGQPNRKGGQVMNPVVVMGADLMNQWHFIYSPWYNLAKKNSIERPNGGMIPAVRLVLRIIQAPIFPGALDASERLKKGTSLAILKSELAALARRREQGSVLYDSGDDSTDT